MRVRFYRCYPPALGDLKDRSVCKGRHWEVDLRRMRSRSPSFVFLGYGSASFLYAQPCSLHRCRLPPRSRLLRWTPRRCFRPRLPSLSFCGASECWTTEPFASFSPKTSSNENVNGGKVELCNLENDQSVHKRWTKPWLQYLKPPFFLVASRGRLHWLQKKVIPKFKDCRTFMAHQVETTTTEIYRKDISSLNIFSYGHQFKFPNKSQKG